MQAVHFVKKLSTANLLGRRIVLSTKLINAYTPISAFIAR